mmetsp:Transcript_44479/g.32599  ORF Transcript_44479/g.32599 Transcript_44479/m.32599 type:complete len:121 (+) Transcript_44479:1393-1755(+)
MHTQDTQTVQLKTNGGADLCSSVEVVSYSLIKCTTKAMTVNSGTELSVSVGGIVYSCQSDNTADCEYSTSTSMPNVDSISASTDFYSLTFTGSGFLDSGYTATAYYAGVASSIATIDSAT